MARVCKAQPAVIAGRRRGSSRARPNPDDAVSGCHESRASEPPHDDAADDASAFMREHTQVGGAEGAVAEPGRLHEQAVADSELRCGSVHRQTDAVRACGLSGPFPTKCDFFSPAQVQRSAKAASRF